MTVYLLWHNMECMNYHQIHLTLSPLAVNFDDRWWPTQTIWIQMKPHKMWGFIWDPNCLTFRLYYISKKIGWKHIFLANFEEKIYLKKITQHAKRYSCLRSRSEQSSAGYQIRCVFFYFLKAYFFTKTYVWPLVRIVSSRRF